MCRHIYSHFSNSVSRFKIKTDSHTLRFLKHKATMKNIIFQNLDTRARVYIKNVCIYTSIYKLREEETKFFVYTRVLLTFFLPPMSSLYCLFYEKLDKDEKMKILHITNPRSEILERAHGSRMLGK